MRTSAILILMLVVSARADTESKALPSADILQLIKTAEVVYVFPYTSSANPKPDRRHLRALNSPARETLKRLLGDSRNWFDGFINAVEPLGVRSVGALFRNKGEELILFFDPTTISGNFRARSYYGGLENEPMEKLEKWKK